MTEIVFDGTVDAALEEAEVDTGVECVGGLPCQFGVTFLHEVTVRPCVGTADAVDVDVVVVVLETGVEVVVTLLTERSFHFQKVEPLGGVLHEGFFLNVPGGGY